VVRPARGHRRLSTSRRLLTRDRAGRIEQVADSLKALEHDAEGCRRRTKQSARQAKRSICRKSITARALVAYPDVLTADVQFHQRHSAACRSAQRQQAYRRLVVALGGGGE